MTNFPNGVASFGMPVIPGIANFLASGQTFFVCNRSGANGSNNNDGTSPELPLTTLTAALAKCVSGRGDTIIVMEGHAETISSAGGLAISKAGVRIIGCGSGSQRPTLTWATATTATCTITAAGVLISNILCTSTIAALVTLFSISAAGVQLDRVDYQEDGSTDALSFVTTTAAADDLTIQYCNWVASVTAASALRRWIILTGADRAHIIGNYLNMKGFATANPANGAVVGVTTASLNVRIEGNTFIDSNSTGNITISMLANSTGVIRDNAVATSKTSQVGSVAPASCYAYNNFATNNTAASGLLDPVADS